MAGKLTQYVVLRESESTEPKSFGPKDDLPDWAEEQLKDSPHLFEEDDDDDDDEPKLDKSRGEIRLPKPADQKPITGNVPGAGALTEPAATELGRSQVVPDEGDGEEPKRNASRAEWQSYAEQNGVPVTEDDDRAAIIEACEEAGVIESR